MHPLRAKGRSADCRVLAIPLPSTCGDIRPGPHRPGAVLIGRVSGPFPGTRFPPRAFPAGLGLFCLAACRGPLAPTRAVRPGPSLAPGRFSLWESPQRSGDVARIRCVPRVSVPKPCIRASAPHAPVFRGSENTIDMQGFARCGLLDAARLLREAVSFAAVRLCRGLLRKRAAFSRWDRRTSGMASFDARFKSLLRGRGSRAFPARRSGRHPGEFPAQAGGAGAASRLCSRLSGRCA